MMDGKYCVIESPNMPEMLEACSVKSTFSSRPTNNAISGTGLIL